MFQTKVCHSKSIYILYFAEDVRSSGAEIASSYEQLPVLECEGFKEKVNNFKSHHSQKMYQTYKGRLTKLNNTKLLQRCTVTTVRSKDFTIQSLKRRDHFGLNVQENFAWCDFLILQVRLP